LEKFEGIRNKNYSVSSDFASFQFARADKLVRFCRANARRLTKFFDGKGEFGRAVVRPCTFGLNGKFGFHDGPPLIDTHVPP
jgi:hypothetical protein